MKYGFSFIASIYQITNKSERKSLFNGRLYPLDIKWASCVNLLKVHYIEIGKLIAFIQKKNFWMYRSFISRLLRMINSFRCRLSI